MSSEPRARTWWDPTWTRLVGSTVVLFLVILALLVGRVRVGADPGLARDASQTTQQTPPPASQRSIPPAGGADPNDPFATPPADQGGTTGGSDGFGNAVPDQSGSGSGDDGTQGSDPPATHVS